MSTISVLSSHCTENPPVLSPTCGSGTVVEFAGLKTYITGSESSSRAILLLSDAFGYEAPNLRKLADKVAEAGFFVVVPDYFYGDPVNPDGPNDMVRWLNTHTTEKGCETSRAIIAALKSKGMTAVGAAGYCWGGSVVVKLAKFDDLKAGVVVHPGRLTVEEIEQVKIPVSLLGAETDEHCPAEDITNLGRVLAKNLGIDNCFVKIFPGVTHGWALRYKPDNENAVRSAEESHIDMLDWITKYVH
jgi:carboxymethylenebutenolidase